jgi:hypothetical protein
MTACQVAAPWLYPPPRETRREPREDRSSRTQIQHATFCDILRIQNRILHVRVINHFLLAKEMNRFHSVATLPEQMAQVAIRANFLADRLAHFQQRDRIIDHKILGCISNARRWMPFFPHDTLC